MLLSTTLVKLDNRISNEWSDKETVEIVDSAISGEWEWVSERETVDDSTPNMVGHPLPEQRGRRGLRTKCFGPQWIADLETNMKHWSHVQVCGGFNIGQR